MTGRSDLTKEQCEGFLQHGYLRLPHLIPAHICQDVAKEVWQAMSLSPTDPEHWPEGWLLPTGYDFSIQREQIKSLMTPALDGLAGADLFDWVTIEEQIFHPIVIFPYNSIIPWQSPIELKKAPNPKFKSMYPHLDVYDVNLGKKSLRNKWIKFLQKYKFSFLMSDDDCQPLVLSFLIYLHDVTQFGGATVLWPGSHIKLEDLALKSNCRPPALVEQGHELGRPFYEAVGHCGDLIIYARNLIHSSSMNLSPAPRFALQGRIILTPAGIHHCRKGFEPRTVIEGIYDRHFADYKRYHYFGD